MRLIAVSEIPGRLRRVLYRLVASPRRLAGALGALDVRLDLVEFGLAIDDDDIAWDSLKAARERVDDARRALADGDIVSFRRLFFEAQVHEIAAQRALSADDGERPGSIPGNDDASRRIGAREVDEARRAIRERYRRLPYYRHGTLRYESVKLQSLYTALAALASWIVVWGVTFSAGLPLLPVAALSAGIAGATVSAVSWHLRTGFTLPAWAVEWRSAPQETQSHTQDVQSQMLDIEFEVGAIRVIVGGVGGLFVFVLLQTGVVVPPSEISLAVVLSSSFVAGFSERLLVRSIHSVQSVDEDDHVRRGH